MIHVRPGIFSARFCRIDYSSTGVALKQCTTFRRGSHVKTKWAVNRSRKSPTEEALNILDSTYGHGPYEKNWKSARLALLSTQKYCAVINNFSANSDKMDQYMREQGALPISDLFRKPHFRKHIKTYVERQESDDEEEEDEDAVAEGPPSDLPPPGLSKLSITEKLNVLSGSVKLGSEDDDRSQFMPATRVESAEDEDDIEDNPPPPPSRTGRLPLYNDSTLPYVPDFLRAYVFPRGDISRFPGPEKDLSGYPNYYLMDAASLLPVLALNLQLGDRILDMCAAPGGKSMAMLQTMLPAEVVCNDASAERTRRLRRVLSTFCPLDSPLMKSMVSVTNRNGIDLSWYEEPPYNKVLVDAPCTVDRVSLNVEENNMFTGRRAGERNKLPQVQLDLLVAACENVQVGGTVVYSTCSLSPIQNDGVVHLAVEELLRRDIKMILMDTYPFVEAFRAIYRFHFEEEDGYGQTVLPHISNNFGPTYFAKLRRLR